MAAAVLRFIVVLLSASFSHAMVMGMQGPHQAVSANTPQERFLAKLLDELWFAYRERVSYASKCEAILTNLTNDHIAFRTLGGIHRVSRIFEALGYEAKMCYNFPDKHLTAIHYEHRSNSRMPKMFISELKAFELDEEARSIIDRALEFHRPDVTIPFLAQLRENPTQDLIPSVLDYFETLPWRLPTREEVEILNKHSQYAAWVLVHGYRVNHFTALVSPPDTLDSVVEKFRSAGLPMKATIEGEAGSKLRQTSTQAVVTNVDIMGDDGHPTTMPWTYAYMEFAERNTIGGMRFEGFLGPQATELFEMTKTTDSDAGHGEL
jgi:Domain of unknown function (DUF1338)